MPQSLVEGQAESQREHNKANWHRIRDVDRECGDAQKNRNNEIENPEHLRSNGFLADVPHKPTRPKPFMKPLIKPIAERELRTESDVSANMSAK